MRYAIVELKVRHQRVGAQHGWDNPPAGKTGVCFVRNPFTWYASMWAYIQRPSYAPIADQPIRGLDEELKNNWTRLAYLNKLAARYGFKDFLTRVTTEAPGIYSTFCEPYVSRSKVISKMETMHSDLFWIMLEVNETFTGKQLDGPINESPPEAKRLCVYDDDMKEAVMVAERKSFERFGYGE